MMKRSILTAAVAGMALSFAPAWVWAQVPSETGRYLYGPHMWSWGGGWYMIFGPLFMILVLAAVIGAVVLLVRWVGGPWQGAALSHHASADRTPLDILKDRFARGEIDKNEFEERRRVLGV